MADNIPFEFFVIVEQSQRNGGQLVRSRTARYMPLDQQVAKGLEDLFTEMANEFLAEHAIEIEFDGRYSPSAGERFVISGFSLDPSIESAAISPLKVPKLDLSLHSYPQIKAVIATQTIPSSVKGSPPNIRIIFQDFKTDKIIRQGRALFHMGGTFHQVEQSGLAIANKVDAVYEDGSLHFRSYYTANRFLDLTQYFRDASKEEIVEILKGDKLATEDQDALLEMTDATIKRKFGIIKQTGILEKVTPEQIQESAAKQGLQIELDVSNGKKRILIPPEKSGAKELLDFLCEGRFIGALTNEIFVSNSHRPVGKHVISKKVAKPKAVTKKSAKKRPRS